MPGQTSTAPARRLRPGVGHQDSRVGPMLRAQALADRAPAERAVEREVVRRQLFEAASATVARTMLAVTVHMPVGLVVRVADPCNMEHPLAQVERRFDRVSQARARGSAHDRPVDHHLDPVLAAVAQPGWAVQLDRRAVHTDAGKTRGSQLVPERLEGLAVAPLDGCHDEDLRSLGQVEDLLDDLVGGLGADRNAAARAMGMPQPGHEDAQVVVNFGDRADRRARALAGRLLLDADRRRKPADPLDPGFLERGQELAGVAREALDIPPLALGIKRVDGQRALARAGRPAANGHLVPGDVQVNALEVVLPRAPHGDGVQTLLG